MNPVSRQVTNILLEGRSARRRRDEAISEMNQLADKLCELTNYERKSNQGRMLSGCIYAGDDFQIVLKKVMEMKKPATSK